MNYTLDWPRLAELIDKNNDFVLTSHIRPDCDALGSELAAAEMLESLGKRVRIVNGHPTPPALSFLDPVGKIEVIGDTTSIDDVHGDCLMVLDTSAWAQLGPMAEVVRGFKGDKMCVDHHVGQDDLGTEFFKDTSAEATGQLVYQIAKHLKIPVTRQMATALYCAIATDTGWFRFGSTTGETYRTIADLVDVGANPAEIYGDLYEQDTIGRVRLRGRILSRVLSEMDGALVHTYVRKEDFTETGALPTDTEDAINLTLAITQTKFSFIMIEQLKGGFKVSFRSRSRADCNEIAASFGGGGHRAAAGAFIEGEFHDVQTRILTVVRAAMQAA